MVSMGSLPTRVGGGAVRASRGSAVTWPGARPNGNCGAEKPGACRGVRNGALPPRAAKSSPRLLPPRPGAILPTATTPKSSRLRTWRGRLAANDAQESGAGGSDGAPEIAGRSLRYKEDRAAQENGDEEIAAKEGGVARNVCALDPAGQRGGLTRPEQGPTSTPARWPAGLSEEEERARAQSGERAHLQRGARGHVDEDRQAPVLAVSSPLYPPAQDRDPRSDPLRPIPPPPTPALRQRASDVTADPPTRRAGAARGRDTWGVRVGRSSNRRGHGHGATTQRRGASSFARAAQRALRQRAREGGETLGDDSGNGSAGDPSFIPEREGSSSPSTEEEEADPAQGVGKIPTRGRTASAIHTPQNRATRGNRAATNVGVTTTPDTPTPIVSADDLAGHQDLFADIATWDLSPLCDSRQPPLARHPPRPLHESFAIFLLTPLLHLAKNPDSPPGWKLLMFLPRILLHSLSARKPDWKAMGDRLTRFRQGLWHDLYNEAADAVTNNPQPRHVPDTTGKLARAERLAERGNLAKSLQSLIATAVCTPSAEVLSALTVRHPEASLAIPGWVHDFAFDTIPSITARDFKRLLARCPNGVGAGPSGTTFEHLRDAALGNVDVLVQLHALTNTALIRKLSAEATDLLTASRLLAFSKPQGGTRPIAVGECLLHLNAKAALFLAAPAAREHFIPLQFGVAIAGGIEAAIHTLRTYLEEFPGATALQIDLANAFNAVEHAAVFEGLKGTAFDFLVPLVRLSYGRPSALYLDHDFGAEPLQSARGVRQGDPLEPMLFAASIHSCLVATAAAHPKVVLLAYADDIIVLGEAANCTAAFTHLTEALLSLSLAHNPAKCEAWSSIAVDPATIAVSLDGVRVLGSPIGPPTGCAARVRERLSAAAELLPLLSQMDPQLCLLLLTRCGEELLHTYLAAAHTKIPRDRAERGRIWQQAALPASLGGLGITNPVVEGGFAYLASVVSAAHLLRSFDDSKPALTGLLPLMDADEESTSLLPRRLAALEAELPLDGIEALQGGGRIATHHALQDECAKIAAEAGFTVHKETTAYSPVENLKADISIRHPDTGEVWICDITVTDPVSFQDEQAHKAPGWAARMQADKKESKYAGRSAWVGFYALAVETYGYPSPGVLDFLHSCAELAGKQRFNVDPKSREVAKLLTEYWQRWSVTLQRAQANALRDKTHEALTADVLSLQGPFTPLSEGQLYQLVEDPSGY
ncbi:unnamed protein product [Closterium sp. NIES-54]